MFNSNILPNSALLRDISLQNMSDLDFDLSRSVNVKYNHTIGLPVYGFLLRFTDNILPTLTHLQYISLQNLSDFDLSSSNVTGMLVSPYVISNWCLIVTWPNSVILRDILG